ncbi:kinetochore protein CHL4 like-domain-containing protein [Sporodiniella umbellata]|nr:kinetochore protein CHL4 like-domain-containing protein [Sporodiniella umbellata]
MLSEKDLKLIKYGVFLNGALTIAPLPALRNAVSLWFDFPEFRPRNNSQLEDYISNVKYKSRADIIQRIKMFDWPDGLCTMQLAQLEIQTMMFKTAEKNWRIFEIVKKFGKINSSIEIDVLKHQLYSFLSGLHNCYVYAFNKIDMDAYWFYIKFYTDNTTGQTRPKRQSGFLIYYPETSYMLVHSNWTKDMNPYVNEAILHAFSADKIIIQKLAAAHFQEITEQIMSKRSLGVFGQLKNNEFDSNPLDIRQKRAKDFADGYTGPGEKKRRIVPVDISEMKERYDAMSNYFGPNEIVSYRSLDIELDLPLQTNDSKAIMNDSNEESIKIDINFKGTNVIEGLRQMVLTGAVEPPLPLWLENVAVSLATKIYVNKDGVSIEEYESDKESLTVEDIMAEMEEERRSQI